MRVSVIVPSVNGYDYLAQCVDSLQQQTSPPDEVIVIDSTPDKAASRLPQFQGLMVHTVEEPIDVPAMRSLGMQLATGDIVALTEDHCTADPAWCDALKDLHTRFDEPVIGGAVENASTQNAVNWAAYFCEYLDFMLPLNNAPAGPVPGNNVSYKRGLLDMHAALFQQGWWEFFLHDELLKAGVQFRMNPEPKVFHRKIFTIRSFQRQSFYFARSFAEMRAGKLTAGQRWMHRLLSPLLPALTTLRLAGKARAKKRHTRELWLSLPIIFWFQFCWCMGEMWGYWRKVR